MNPSFEYHSSFYSPMEIVKAVVVLLVASVFCFGLYYLHHSEYKKRNLCNSSKSRTFGIRALIV
jgi:intracellular septation protein A